MPVKTIKVKLEGQGELHQPVIRLENIKVNLTGSEGGTVWENKSVIINVEEELEIFMSCKAISGTAWEFSVGEKGSDKKCYEAEGSTGEELDSKDGESIPNYSERKVSVTC